MSEAVMMDRYMLFPIDERSYVRRADRADPGPQAATGLQTIDLDQLSLVAGGASWSEWGSWAGGIVGNWVGSTAGGAAGAWLGSFAGPIGAAIGYAAGQHFGGMIGESLGSQLGAWAGQQLDNYTN